MVLNLKYKGFNYPDFYNGEYSTSNLNASLPDVVATGANSVAMTPDFGIDIAASTVYAGGATTDTTANLAAAITAATKAGLSSFVRPLVDFLYPQESTTYPGNYYVTDGNNASNPNGYYTSNLPSGVTPSQVVTVPVSAYGDGDTVNYRGELSPSDINVAKFFGSATTVGSYDYVIVQEAKAAQADGATLFSIGTELDSLADDAAAASYWNTLIADVRAVFSGKLTYSSNWATAGQVSFWSKLDYVGIDGYVPLSNTVPDAAGDNNPSLTSLVNAWSTPSNVVVAYSDPSETVSQVLGGLSVIDYFDELAQDSISKQFIFTEFGYQNDTGAATDPTGGSATGVLDPTLQAELYQSFFTAWSNAQLTAALNSGKVDGIPYSLAGAYIWEYDPDTSTYSTTAANYDNWTPSSQALSVIEAGFGSVSPPVVVTETNVAGEAGYEGTPNPARGTAGTGGTGALAGDSDPGGTGMTITAVQGGTIGTFFNTTYGSLQLNADGSYVYYVGSPALSAPTGTPPVDTITYTVTDELGASSTATLKITDYRDPTAVAESATVNAGKSVIGTPGTTGTGALKGDTDPDGITPTISNYYDPTLINPPPAIGTAWAGKYGTVTIFANGTYSYTADSAATLAADFVAAGGQPLVDGFDYVVAGGDGTYTTSTLSITIPPPTPPDNYVANGKSALVLQNDAGPIVIESQSNLAVTGGATITGPGPSWHVVSTADMDGNGSPDLLLQNDNGTVVDYIMSGTTVVAGHSLTDPGSSWHVRGVGDFNGDGKGDIVLQNDNGTIVIDYTNGSAVIGGATIGNPGPGWTVEGVADFNGDGQSDLLLENTNGQIVDFLMNGATPVAGYLLTTLPAGWSVAGTGNYNGDNDADIVVHNDNGTDVVLNTNGQSIISSAAPIGDPGPTWTGVVAGMDLNGDGASDLVVENTSGSLVGFTLNTSDAVTQGASLGTPGVGWSVIGNTPMQFIDGTGPTLAPLTGTVGADEFNLTSLGVPGLHSINGFDPAMDLVALSAATFPTYAAVQAAEQPYQGGTFIALPNASGLLIQGTTPSQLSSSDFVLR